jgi:hypothetical protein
MNPIEYSLENILRNINNQMEAENEEETWDSVRKCYDQREDK